MVQLTVTHTDIIHSEEIGERKQGKESTHLVSNLTAHLASQLFSRVIYITCPEKNGSKEEGWRRRKERKYRGWKEKDLLSGPQVPRAVHSKLKCSILCILWEKKKKKPATTLLSRYCLFPSAPQAKLAQRKSAAGPYPGQLKVTHDTQRWLFHSHQ